MSTVTITCALRIIAYCHNHRVCFVQRTYGSKQVLGPAYTICVGADVSTTIHSSFIVCYCFMLQMQLVVSAGGDLVSSAGL